MRRVERRGSGRGEAGQRGDRMGRGLAGALRRGDVAQDFGMGQGDGEQRLGRAGWCAAALFPIVEGAHGDAEQGGVSKTASVNSY